MVRVTVENTAERDGREVVRVYVRPPAVSNADRPVRELADFESVAVAAGEGESVAIDLDERASTSERWPATTKLTAGRSILASTPSRSAVPRGTFVGRFGWTSTVGFEKWFVVRSLRRLTRGTTAANGP
ncbi:MULTISPECIES: fibronectin type III-like domain-contianing protein [Natrialbaceae]|uniref:fibronectin type III-like domain-contianing protein n=1 Tax=Natrialbaceae TaxID=1644061 RepID=UPI00207CC03B|nr:fibronectin type III-like domain-contianing protein [Natronococcus sp. CG52]